MTPTLPYPKPPAVPKPPSSLSKGLPKFKRIFKGPKALIQPPSAGFQQRLPYMLGDQSGDYSTYSPRANLVRMLKQNTLGQPDGISAQLLQALQGGGKPQDQLRREFLHHIVRNMLGGR